MYHPQHQHWRPCRFLPSVSLRSLPMPTSMLFPPGAAARLASMNAEPRCSSCASGGYYANFERFAPYTPYACSQRDGSCCCIHYGHYSRYVFLRFLCSGIALLLAAGAADINDRHRHRRTGSVLSQGSIRLSSQAQQQRRAAAYSSRCGGSDQNHHKATAGSYGPSEEGAQNHGCWSVDGERV